MKGILNGIKVVELASWTFVPAAGAVLADWGADVVKIEDTRGGDPARGLVVGGLKRENASADADYMMEIGNRGKRSVGLDLKSEKGRELFGRLIASADVFLTNWLPGPRSRAKVDVEDIRAMNPNIIYARGSGQGPRGAEKDRGGFDAASFSARGGVAYALTPPGASIPFSQGPAFGDLPGGMTLAGGVAAALFRRERTGEPSVVDVSLLAQAMWTMAPDIIAAELFDVDRIPVMPDGMSLNPVTAKYRTRDDRWIQLVFLQPDRFWRDFCVRIGRADLATDERFVPSQNLIRNNAEATALLQETFASQDLEHWKKALADEPGVWSVLASPQEVLSDPQALANDYLVPNKDAAGQDYHVVAAPVQFDEQAPSPGRAPEWGEHTETVLIEAGVTWEEIAEAKEAGAIL
ncbi:CaiB/BaiF CoA transferase family protein [Streptomyces sp. NPDC020792]|uniref:CaiB/BaiF CoA transferase family protein n=1 Tax=Streptomyces sp. NPDC020792 TaxID=3365089 RepID=UPI00378CA34E